jgi:hypothetical protein
MYIRNSNCQTVDFQNVCLLPGYNSNSHDGLDKISNYFSFEKKNV